MMRQWNFRLPINPVTTALVLLLVVPSTGWTHGFAGKRFFPTTLVLEDPFVADELSLPYIHIKMPDEEDPDVKVTTDTLGIEYSKRLTEHWGISLGTAYLNQDFPDDGTRDGFGNIELGTKYQVRTLAEKESLLSLGLSAEIGDSGNASVGVEPYTIISPALYFAKGMGDLQAHPLLRPVALTGLIAANYPSQAHSSTGAGKDRNPTTISYGLSLQYQINYLQSFVKDFRLRSPLNHMIPEIEFALETCVNSACRGDTTATANPGLLWFGNSMELGLGAQIPLNHRTGDDVGLLLLVHLFVDDMFPNSLGRPLFGE